MKDSTAKTLLNYSTSLTKVTNKKLETTKSPDDRIEIISKQFEDIKKKVAEVVEKGEPIRSEGDSVIKLEFDKLNKRLDIIEATDYAKSNFIMGLMKGDGSESNIIKSDNNDDKSLMDNLNELFKDGLLSTGLGLMGTAGKTLLGLATNPYVLVTLAAIAAAYGLSVLIKNGAEEAHEQTQAADTGISGTTQEQVEDLFSQYSGGKTMDWYLKMLTDPGISEQEKDRLESELNNILSKVRDKTVENITTQVTDQGSVSTTAADMAVNTKKVGDDIKAQEKLIFTKWDQFKNWASGQDKDKLFSDTLSAVDMSALGSLYGDSVSASQVIGNINESYGSIYNVDSSNLDFNINLSGDPSITSFDYSNPIDSIKKIAIEYTKIAKAKWDSGSVEATFNDKYSKLFNSFTYAIGRRNLPRNTDIYWDTFRDQELHPLTDKGWIFVKDGDLEKYAKKLYDAIPSYKTLCEVYFSKSYDESRRTDNRYASLMTIKHQYELLGSKLDPHSELSEITTRFYFLPKIVTSGYKTYTLNDNLRITLNQIGIIKAYKSEVSGNDSISNTFQTDFDLLADQALAQNTREAYNLATNGIGMIHAGDYSTDTIVIGQLKQYSGIEDESKLEQLARELQGYSYEDLLNASETHSGDVYNKILSQIGSKSKTDTVIDQLLAYQESSMNSHKDDIIESYNAFNPNNKITSEDLDRMLDKISSDKSLRDKYMKARNSKNRSEKEQLYYEIAKVLGLNTGMLGYTDIKNYVDRIFQNYVDKGLHDEESDTSIDLDAAVRYYMGVSGFSTEDLSSTVDLWGMGTADDLVAKGWSPEQVAEFIRVASKSIDSQAVANDNGSIDTVYNQSGINNESDIVRNAVIEAIKSSGINDNLIKLLESNGLISNAQAAMLYSGSNYKENVSPDISENPKVE